MGTVVANIMVSDRNFNERCLCIVRADDEKRLLGIIVSLRYRTVVLACDFHKFVVIIHHVLSYDSIVA